MANDLSNPVNTAASNQASHDDFFGHDHGADSLFGKVQLAQAGSGAAAAAGRTIHVPAPDAAGGPVVVRIEVAPGSTIALPQPFDADAALLAKEGDGNLAIRVGDVTVILQGYVDANSAQPVIVEGADNQPIDIATVLAATDPAIDIQTAAGPDAGQGGQGADNTGAILAQLDGGEGLGGLAAVGGQDQTQLSYTLIDGSIRQEFAATTLGAAGPVFGFSVGTISGAFNEGFLRDPAQKDSFTNASGTFFDTFMDEYRDAVEHPGQAMFAGWADFYGTAVTQNNDFKEYLSQTCKTVTVDAQFTGGTGDLVLTGIGNDVTSNGSKLTPEIRDDGHTMFLRRDDDNALVAVVHVEGPDASGQFTIETFLINRIDHDGDGNAADAASKDTMNIDVQFTVYDGPAPNPEQGEQGGPASPSIEGSFSAGFADDVPILEDVRYHNQHEDKVPAARSSEGGSSSDIGLIDEDWLKGGAHDQDAAHQSNAGADGDTGGGTCVTGCIVVNFGADGAAKSDGKTEAAGKHAFVLDTAQYKLGDAFPYNGGTLTSGKETLVVLSVGPDHLTVGIADGKQPALVGAETNDASPTGPTDPIPGCPIFTLSLDPDTGSFKFELKGPLDHSDSIFGDETGVSALAETQPEQTIPLAFGVTAYDDDGDYVQAEIDIDVNDDVPVARNDEDTVAKGSFAEISGNVISGLNTDSPAAGKDSQGGDHAAVTGIVSAVATGVVGKEIQGSYGKLILNADGSYTYTRDHGPNSKGGVDDVFTYTLTDGDGDTSTATLTIHIKDSGVCIELPSCPADTTVSEAGLPARLGEAPGSSQFSDSEQTGGTIHIDAKDGIASLQIGSHELTLAELKDLGDTPLKIEDSTGTLTLTGFDETSGALSYTYVLKDNTLNTNGSSVSFDITVKDADADEKTATLTINIRDDAPTANCDQLIVGANKDATADVQFILDISGSMESRHVNVPGYPDTGVGLERYSIEQMLNAHPEIQNVQIVLFDDHATHSEWMTRDEAIAWVKDGDNFDHGGGATNYDAALNEAMEGFVETRPLPASDQTLVYFFSDGNPNQPGGPNSGINNNGSGSNVSTAEWEAFVTGHAISNVFVVGVGNIDGTEFSQLTPISYPNTDAHAPAGEDNVLNITSSNVGTLLDSLNHSIVPVLNTFTGDLTQNDVSGADGFGSGKLVSASYNGINYVFNATTHEHTIDLGAGRGTLVLKDDGTYAYTPPVESQASGKPFAIDYTIQDGDGDQSTAQLKIDINIRPATDLNGPACEGADNHADFVEQNAVQIAPHATVSDDGDIITYMMATLTSRPDGDGTESLGLNGAAQAFAAANSINTTYDPSTGVLLVYGPGTASDYQTILQGIVYNNSSDTPNTTDRHVTVVVNDGVKDSILHSVDVCVTPVNDAPDAAINQDPFSAVEQTELTLSGPGRMAISDVDAGNDDVTVTLHVTGGDLYASKGNSGVNWVSGNGTDTITINGTVAEINKLLAGTGSNGTGKISYENDSDSPPSSVELKLTVNDNGQNGIGGAKSDFDTATITIQNVNDKPVTDLNGGSYGSDNKVYFQEDYGAIKIAPSATITDDSGRLTSMTVSLASRPDGAQETLSLNTDAETARINAGLSITNVNGVITISGATPVDAAVFQTILRGIVYNNASDTPDTHDRTVTVTVKDEGNLVSTAHTVTIDVDPTNDAPTAVIAPASFNAKEEIGLILSGKGFSIGDVDAGNGTMTVTLKVGEGELNVTKGSTGVSVSNSGSDTVTLTGTIAQINNLLDGKNGGIIEYYNDKDSPASQTTLTLKVDDNGHTGEGPDLTATDTAIIYIENTPDAPVACNDHVITNAGTNLFNIPEWALLYNDSDPDTASSNLHLVSGAAGVLNASGGVVGHPNGADYVTFDDSNGNGHSEFDYKMTDGSQTSTAEVEVSQDNLSDGELNGGSGDDIIVVYGSAGVTVKADGGDDIVIGGSGKDRLDGGSGTDLIFGQGGDDTMIFSSTSSSGSDKFDGGSGFDRVQLTNGNINIGYDTGKFINVEMIDLGDSNPRDFSENKLALSAGDLVAGHAGTLGGHSIALYVIGDNNGNSAGKDNVDLTGFNMVAVGSVNNVTDAATGQMHNYDIYQGTGANAGIKVAVEHGLDVV